MDQFDYYFDGEGCYIITRNGDFFLSCCGTEAETKNIVELLRRDSERNEKNGTWRKVLNGNGEVRYLCSECNAMELFKAETCYNCGANMR